jgi:hypothetical protein
MILVARDPYEVPPRFQEPRPHCSYCLYLDDTCGSTEAVNPFPASDRAYGVLLHAQCCRSNNRACRAKWEWRTCASEIRAAPPGAREDLPRRTFVRGWRTRTASIAPACMPRVQRFARHAWQLPMNRGVRKGAVSTVLRAVAPLKLRQ